MIVLIWSLMWNGLIFLPHSHTHTFRHTYMERPACAGFLFMSGDFYQEQAVLCCRVGSSPDFVLLVTVGFSDASS